MKATQISDVTQILSQIESGDPEAAARLLPLVYEELRRLAAARMAMENPGQTLQATALVHEAFIRLVGKEVDLEKIKQWNSRAHFFGAASEAMRRILVENARRKQRVKHGAGRKRVELDAVASLESDSPANNLLALDNALRDLAAVEPEKASIVELRYFGGLSWEEIAACRGISLATVKRHWLVARAWLYDALTND